jgi:gluconate 2-dehydrogenase
VVNTARGGILDEEALCDRLDDGRLFAAALDVFEGEPTPRARLLAAPHLVLTPHVGSATRQTRHRMITLAAERLADSLASTS